VPTIDPQAGHATFINTFTCQPTDQAGIVRVNIDIVENVAVHSPGFISATVHRSIDGSRVFNYLQWETPQDLATMQQSDAFRATAKQFHGLIAFEPHQCEVIHAADRRQ
jgi:heme-degrading monooxygenase HmoA